MAIKALIIDLDNTIYPVSSIGDRLFSRLFTLIESSYPGDMEPVRREVMRKPFQVVARDFGFNASLMDRALEHLRKLEVREEIAPYSDYTFIQNVKLDKFLVTTGFTRMQQSKIDKLGIRGNFREIFIVDPDQSELHKGDVFRGIMDKYGYSSSDLMVIGDDLQSEIYHARQMGITAFHYDRQGVVRDGVIRKFDDLMPYLPERKD